MLPSSNAVDDDPLPPWPRLACYLGGGLGIAAFLLAWVLVRFPMAAFPLMVLGSLGLEGAVVLALIELTLGSQRIFAQQAISIWVLIAGWLGIFLLFAMQRGLVPPGLAMLPALFMAPQLVLWSLRFFFRWRFAYRPTPPADDVWTLRDFGFATVVLGVILAVIRLADLETEELRMLVGGSVLLLIAPPLLVVPPIWFYLRLAQWKWIVALSFLQWLIVTALLLFGVYGSNRTSLLVQIFAATIASTWILAGVHWATWALYQSNVRLVWGREMKWPE